MTIVASNSLTISNVNDGTITHIAYSYSADGTDRFYVGGGTNLLQGTGTASGDVSGGGGTLANGAFNGYDAVKTNNAWDGRYINLKQALSRTNAKAGDWYTISVYVKADKQIDTGSLDIYRALGNGDAWTNDGGLISISVQDKPITTQWQQYSWSFQINNISLQRESTRVEYNNATGDNWIYWAGWMLEKGTTANPWSPAPSEAHPSYIGQYTDFNTTASTDPAKYAPWIIFKGKDGATGERGKQVFKSSYESVPNSSGHWWSDLSPAPSTDNPPKIGDTVITPSGNILQIDNVIVGDGGGGGTFGVGDVLGTIKGPAGKDGIKGVDGTDAPTITVKSYTFSAGSRAEIELTGPNAFKQTVYNRGHNVWVIDATTHKLKEFVSCDTYNTMSFSYNGVSTTLADYLASLKDSIVVIASSDADAVDQNVRNILNCMGGSPDLGTWDSWRMGHVFIGMSKRNDGTWPLQPRQGYEEANKEDGSTPEIGCTLSKGGIVANGATGAKGSDSYIHTAYAYSADGKDGFTTIYPNLNLGDNTKTFAGAEGSSNPITGSIIIDKAVKKTQDGYFVYLTATPTVDNYDWFRFFLIPYPETPNMTKVAVKSNTKYTFSVWLKGTGTHRIYAYKDWTAPNTPSFLDVDLTGDWKLYTFTVTSSNGIPADNVQFFIRSNNGTEISLKKPKVEEGSIATPYMPSKNEVKTSDYPSYIGTYSDSNVESSLDYSKYQWAIFKGQNSNAYVAYSWSSDGTDRFTTTYPILNLLKGTKTSISVTGNNSENQCAQLYGFDNNSTLNNQGLSINDTLTIEFDWKATNPSSGQIIFQWNGMPWGFGLPAINLSSTNASGHVVYSYNIRDADINSTATATGMGYRLDYVPTNTVITFSNVIIRKAKSSQPWTPSESESQDQWQDTIPMYIGVGEKDSQNPSDYRWQLNSKYVQASSDSGLSNKAGVDDLASVGNTANDALIQAQNAVSNEDYTSWLEHDYQSTIDNLQEISAQNQDDIKNVDDRTTIVEGFYGEMKVKWNFIDESFSFSEEGMFISNAQSKMSIQITSDKIVFWDNNVDVAFITGEVLNIQKGVFLESATIGNHLITKFSDDSPVTIIRYVGGIT